MKQAVAFTVRVRMRDTMGQPVVGTPTIEVSTGTGAYAPATNAPQAIGGGVGGDWRVLLTADEMSASHIGVEANLPGAMPFTQVLYPEADYTAARAAQLDQLDDILARVQLIVGGGQIQLAQAPSTAGDFWVVIGDDYLDVDGRAFVFPASTFGPWPNLTGADVVLVQQQGDILIADTVTIVNPAGPNCSLKLELAAAVSGALLEGEYPYQLIATLADASLQTLVMGTLRTK